LEGDPPSLAGVEAVADPAHRLDHLWFLGVVLDFRAETLDRDVHEPRIAQVLVVPDALKEQVTGEDLARPPRELEQQLELGRGETDLFSALAGDEGAGIDLEVPPDE